MRDVIDVEAYKLRIRLEHMLDVVEARSDSRLGEVGVQTVPHPLCATVDLDFVTYETGEAISKTTPKKWFTDQLAVCNSCQLKAECLETALAMREPFGIWGGLMPLERQKIRNRRR